MARVGNDRVGTCPGGGKRPGGGKSGGKAPGGKRRGGGGEPPDTDFSTGKTKGN